MPPQFSACPNSSVAIGLVTEGPHEQTACTAPPLHRVRVVTGTGHHYRDTQRPTGAIESTMQALVAPMKFLG